MFRPFLDSLRRHGVPASLREYLDLLAGLQAGLTDWTPDGFYHLARATLIKNEAHIDRFDRAFAETFSGLDEIPVEALVNEVSIPRDWLEKLAEKLLTPDERAALQGPGSFEELMRRLRERLAEQKGRHQGGSKWIGTAGTSPFGAYGYNPEGVRIGQNESRHRRAVKVLLFLDAGGSMDDHSRLVDELFSAARAEFKHLEHFYFHNCVYEALWRDNHRRWTETTPTWDVINRFGRDYKAIFVGDAAMSPYEIAIPGGANEHWNPESGETWLHRLRAAWPDHIWLNPVPAAHWRHTRSIEMVRTIFDDRMQPLTLEGLTRAMRILG